MLSDVGYYSFPEQVFVEFNANPVSSGQGCFNWSSETACEWVKDGFAHAAECLYSVSGYLARKRGSMPKDVFTFGIDLDDRRKLH